MVIFLLQIGNITIEFDFRNPGNMEPRALLEQSLYINPTLLIFSHALEYLGSIRVDTH